MSLAAVAAVTDESVTLLSGGNEREAAVSLELNVENQEALLRDRLALCLRILFVGLPLGSYAKGGSPIDAKEAMSLG